MIISKLKKLQELESTLKSLKNEITDNSKPILTDLYLLSKIKEIVKSEYRKNAFSWRDYFIVVSLFLYYPRGLMGERLPIGLRPALSKQLNIVEPHTSKSVAKNIGYLEVDKSFRSDCEALTVIVLDKLAQ